VKAQFTIEGNTYHGEVDDPPPAVISRPHPTLVGGAQTFTLAGVQETHGAFIKTERIAMYSAPGARRGIQ
jgi:hypothetical protein